MTYGDYSIKNGHLYISGVDSVELAAKYSTPLYVMSEDVIRASCREFKNALNTYYGENGLITYASKAFCTKEMCRIIASEGLGLDAVSGGELYTAHMAGFPMSKVNYHGNNKTDEEIKLGISLGVGRFVADNPYELERIDRFAREAGKIQRILLRITPGIDAHTHDFVKTGQIDSKFGSAIATGAADSITDIALTLENIELVGFHCHIGSQIFDAEPFVEAARVMTDFLEKTEERTGHEFTDLVLGGGFGIKYTDEDEPLSFDSMLKEVLVYLKSRREGAGKKLLHIGFEPGRSIAGPAGVTLYTVGGVKEIPGVRTYVSVDGGLCDNPRYALYGSKYTFITANKADLSADKKVTVCGKCCESGDMLGEGVSLCGDIEAGDILAVTSTGAYNYSMASHYNRVPKPPVVFVSGGRDRLAVARETFADMCERDI